MKFSDINKRYTEIVTEYISSGYTFNAASMGGSQGEIANVDLTNGSEIIRIYVDSFTDWGSLFGQDGVEIVVGRNTDDVIPNEYRGHDTVWNNHLDVIRREKFYKVGDDYSHGRMYGTLEEANAANEKRFARWEAKNIKAEAFTPSPDMIAVAKRIVREKIGYRRITEADIKLEKNNGRYIVSYRSSVHHKGCAEQMNQIPYHPYQL